MKPTEGILKPWTLEVKEGIEWRIARPAVLGFAWRSVFCACILLRLAYGRRLAIDLPRDFAALPRWELALGAGIYLALLLSARWRVLVSGPGRELTWGLYLWDLPLRVRSLHFGGVQTLRVQRRYSFFHGTCYSVDMVYSPSRSTPNFRLESREVVTLLRVSNAVEALYLARELGKLIGCPTA